MSTLFVFIWGGGGHDGPDGAGDSTRAQCVPGKSATTELHPLAQISCVTCQDFMVGYRRWCLDQVHLSPKPIQFPSIREFQSNPLGYYIPMS